MLVENKIAIRLDATEAIGSGHAMRCLSIADALEQLGYDVIFLVSAKQSHDFIKAREGRAVILHGDPMHLENDHAQEIADYCAKENIAAVLVDTYAADNRFMSALNCLLPDEVRVAYIDDLYTFEHGRESEPRRFDLDLVINYDFRAPAMDYRKIYFDSGTALLIGPRYAPIRKEFQNIATSLSKDITRVMITTGSTNPNRALERMVLGCMKVFPEAKMDVVVGPLAKFDYPKEADNNLTIHQNANMIALMRDADIAVSAAGSTLYELVCVGVPTLAIPLVTNQIGNAAGFRDLGLGVIIEKSEWSSDDVSEGLRSLLNHPEARKMYHERGRHQVDGRGARRIAEAISKLT